MIARALIVGAICANACAVLAETGANVLDNGGFEKFSGGRRVTCGATSGATEGSSTRFTVSSSRISGRNQSISTPKRSGRTTASTCPASEKQNTFRARCGGCRMFWASTGFTAGYRFLSACVTRLILVNPEFLMSRMSPMTSP